MFITSGIVAARSFALAGCLLNFSNKPVDRRSRVYCLSVYNEMVVRWNRVSRRVTASTIDGVGSSTTIFHSDPWTVYAFPWRPLDSGLTFSRTTDARSIDGSMNSVWLSQNLTIASCKNSMVARWRLIDGQIVGNFIFTRAEKERLKSDYRGWIRNWIFYSRTDYFRQLTPSWTLCLGFTTIYRHLYVQSLVNIDIYFSTLSLPCSILKLLKSESETLLLLARLSSAGRDTCRNTRDTRKHSGKKVRKSKIQVSSSRCSYIFTSLLRPTNNLQSDSVLYVTKVTRGKSLCQRTLFRARDPRTEAHNSLDVMRFVEFEADNFI